MSVKGYTPNDFQYNGRVALALGPCVAVAAQLGGQPVLVTVAVGAMVSYMMDVMQYREGALTCSWLTLAFMNITFAYSMTAGSDSSPLLLMALITTVCFVSALVGMWISLQFKWIQAHYPPVSIIFERVVLTASLPVAAVMYSLGLASIVDSSDVPYYLAVLLAVMYYGMGRPLPSSFHKPPPAAPAVGGGGRGSKSHFEVTESTVQGHFDGFSMALLTVFLPGALYAAIHWVILFRHAVHVYSLVLLLSVPALYVALLPQGLWWIPGPPRTVAAIRKVVTGVALVAALASFEGRVVFHAFGSYIKLTPPWNVVAVTIGLFGFAAVSVAHVTGALGESIDFTIAGSFLLLCTTAGALAVGVPMQWLPAPLIAAGGLALFYDSRHLREYFVFITGAFMTCVWFMLQHFWFLDIQVGKLHLHLLCQLVLAAVLPALLVPGLVHARASKHSIGALLVVQAVIISLVEDRLYSVSHEDFAGENMYPGYLVMLTSGAGVLAARRLRAWGLLSDSVNWTLHGVYAAKLSMLLLPEAYLVLPTTLLVLAASAPIFFTRDPAPGKRRPKLRLQVGVVYTVAVLLTVAAARFALFDLVQFLLAARPTEGILLGALGLMAAAALAPLVTRCYTHNQVVVRLLAILVMSSVLLIVLQPPMPLAGGARCPKLPLSLCPRLWDERHVPMHSSEDVEVWGRGLSRQEHWPRWLLVAATVLGMCASMLGGAFTASFIGRMALSLLAGLLIGGYAALELVPDELPLQILVLISCLLVVVFVVGLQLPSAKGSVALPIVAFSWLIIFGLTMLLQSELPTTTPRIKRLFPDSGLEVEFEVYQAERAGLLGIFAAHALLFAFVLKLRSSAALRQQDSKLSTDSPDDALYGQKMVGIPVSELFCGMVPAKAFAHFGGMLRMEGSGAVALMRLHHDGLGWVPTAGNLFTILAFLLAISVNMYLTGASPEAIFMLAPLLLLLSQDPIFFTDLNDHQRYFPPVLVATIYLSFTALIQTMSSLGHVDLGFGSFMVTIENPFFGLVVCLLMTAATMPSHIMFLLHLWNMKPRQGTALLMAGPLNLLPLLAMLTGIRYLAILGLLMSLTQFFSMKHHRVSGMKLI